jgi:PAS domain S-box-containing protein
MGTNPKSTVPQTIKSASEILGETKAILKQIEALGNIGHWEANLITGKCSFSEGFFKILGLEPESMVPSIPLGLSKVHPEDRERATAHLQQSIETGIPYKIDKRIIRPGGEIRFVISEGTVDLDASGKPCRIFGIFKDVTEEKLKEEELKKSNIQIDNILNTTQDLVIIAEEAGPFLRVSKSSEKILGYLPEELIGKSFRNMVHPDDFQTTAENRKEVLAGIPSSNFRNRYFKKDGTVITLNWSASFDKSTKTVFAIARDITLLLLTQENLKKDRQKLSIVMDSSPETIWALDKNYSMITANNQFLKTMKRMGNWDVKVGDNLIYNTPLSKKFTEEWKVYYDRGFNGENFSIVRKVKGKTKTVFAEIYFKPIFEKGELIALGCYSKDITRQKEEEIRISELARRLTLAQKIGKLGYWEYDIDTESIYWSDEVFEIWGVEKTQIQPNFELFFNSFHPDDKEEYIVNRTNALAGIAPLDATHRIVLASGEIKYVHEIGELEKDPDSGKIYFRGTVQDITTEKSIENKLIERNQFIEAALYHLPSGLGVNKISTGEFTYINPAFSEIYGWQADTLKNVSAFFEKIFPDPAYRKHITSKILGDIQSGDPKRMSWENIPIITQYGEERIVSARSIPLPDQDLMISTVIDQTETYWANHSLRVSNERFHLATQAVSDAIWDWDIHKNSIFWGKGYHRLFGYPADLESVSPDLWLEKIHPDDLDATWKSILETRKDRTKHKWFGEYRFQRYDGSYAFVKENTVIIRDENGSPIRMVGALEDITLGKQKEKELQKKTALIAATSKIIQDFLETEDWQELMDTTLKLMGETTEVDKVYFFKNFSDPMTGKQYSRQINEWTNGKVSQEIVNPEYQAIPLEDLPLITQASLKGQPLSILTQEADGPTRKNLEKQGIKSLLLMPILVENYFYGFIGFDDCTNTKIWTEDEISFLASVTTNLSFAIERKQNLDKIRLAFESRDSLLESIGDSFYAFDKNYTVTYWNNEIEKLTGIKREEIIGNNLWDLDGVVDTEFRSYFEKAFIENRPQYFETFDNWTKAWLEGTIYPSNGGLSVIVKNITSKKETERQIQGFNERFALISQASHDAIYDWNIETGEHYWGDGFNILFGEEVSGIRDNYHKWEEHIHPEDKQRVILYYLDSLADPSNQLFDSEYRFLRKDGEVLSLLDRATIIRDTSGKAIRVVGAIQDITPRKQYEESLRKLNEELAKSNHELGLSNKELEQFAYVASHDLQEPLRMITSFMGLIEKRYANLLDEKGIQYINFAVDGAKRMKDIILDLLEFSRIGNIKESKKPIRTLDLVREVFLLNDKLIKEKQAIIHVGELPDIMGYVSPMIQVFQNLITNGLKYQRAGEIPEIWIEGKDNDQEWLFSIKDNGIGIDPEFKEKIFIIFQRLHQKEQFTGSGIGLAICKKIVELHGGKIWVESTPGAGSNFYFTLKK